MFFPGPMGQTIYVAFLATHGAAAAIARSWALQQQRLHQSRQLLLLQAPMLWSPVLHQEVGGPVCYPQPSEHPRRRG